MTEVEVQKDRSLGREREIMQEKEARKKRRKGGVDLARVKSVMIMD